MDSYEKNDIVGFSEAWKSFVETFEEAYLDYQFLCNISTDTRVSDLSVNVIFFPLALDISPEEEKLLTDFVSSGGKLIISSGVGPLSDRLKYFLSQNGIIASENIVAQLNLNIKHKVNNIIFELPVGNFYSRFDLTVPFGKVVARWKESNEIAIGGSENVLFFGYSWGQDIDKVRDIETLLKTLDFYWNDISFRLAKVIKKDEYKKTLKEINSLKQEALSVIKVTDQLDFPVAKSQLKKHFDNGVHYLSEFNSNYLFGNYKIARQSANQAKSEFAIAYSVGMPARKIEIRAIWLDRGTIVSLKTPIELRNYIKKLARAGFNIIFFETINAGYPIYPSMLLLQNPLIRGWDPLKVAIEEAHLNGIELHAWVWTFAVGNSRHNLLINQPVGYPGPIISGKGRAWALALQDGKLRIDVQPETWVSPANKKACMFLRKLFAEIVKNYDVDGFQFDYIRFPFQKNDSQAGFDFVTRMAFKEETGMFPAIEGQINRIWKEWKIKLVNDFVRDTSKYLKEIKPDLKISGAVFAIDRSLRLQIIQQDWETWLLNRWVDVVYPFYYSFTDKEVRTKLLRTRQMLNDQAIIIPGFNIRVLSVGELAGRITTARNSGVLGVALFASEHLDTMKEEFLRQGPFREKTINIPYQRPLFSCQKLMEEFAEVIEKLTVTKKFSVLADSQTQKDVYLLTQDLKNDFRNFTPDKINEIEKKLIQLQLKVKDWLSLEKYLDREQRVMYINTYLDQIRILLNYMQGKEIYMSTEN